MDSQSVEIRRRRISMYLGLSISEALMMFVLWCSWWSSCDVRIVMFLVKLLWCSYCDVIDIVMFLVKLLVVIDFSSSEIDFSSSVIDVLGDWFAFSLRSQLLVFVLNKTISRFLMIKITQS